MQNETKFLVGSAPGNILDQGRLIYCLVISFNIPSAVDITSKRHTIEVSHDTLAQQTSHNNQLPNN